MALRNMFSALFVVISDFSCDALVRTLHYSKNIFHHFTISALKGKYVSPVNSQNINKRQGIQYFRSFSAADTPAACEAILSSRELKSALILYPLSTAENL
jgi:hypothetical protein